MFPCSHNTTGSGLGFRILVPIIQSCGLTKHLNVVYVGCEIFAHKHEFFRCAFHKGNWNGEGFIHLGSPLKKSALCGHVVLTDHSEQCHGQTVGLLEWTALLADMGCPPLMAPHGRSGQWWLLAASSLRGPSGTDCRGPCLQGQIMSGTTPWSLGWGTLSPWDGVQFQNCFQWPWCH